MEGPNLPAHIKVELMRDPPPPGGAWALIGETAVKLSAVAALFFGVLYTLGWHYAYFYTEKWGIPFVSLDIPADHLVQYGRVTLTRKWWIILLFVITVIAGFVVIWRFVTQSPLAIVAVIGITAFVTWSGAGWLAKSAVADDLETIRENGYRNLPQAQIFLKSEIADTLPASLRTELEDGQCYRLVFATKAGWWLSRTGNGMPRGAIFFSTQDVIGIHLSKAGANCLIQGAS